MTCKGAIFVIMILLMLLQHQAGAADEAPCIAAGDTLVGQIEGIQSRFIGCCYTVKLEIVSLSETGKISGTAYITPRGSDVRASPFTGQVTGSAITFAPEGAFKFPSTGNLQWKGDSFVGKYRIGTSIAGSDLLGDIMLKLAPESVQAKSGKGCR